MDERTVEQGDFEMVECEQGDYGDVVDLAVVVVAEGSQLDSPQTPW